MVVNALNSKQKRKIVEGLTSEYGVGNDVFREDFVGNYDTAHDSFAFPRVILWSSESAFWTFVGSSEFAAFTVAFHLDFSAVRAEKLCGFRTWSNRFTAASAGS